MWLYVASNIARYSEMAQRHSKSESTVARIEASLFASYGPLVGGRDLQKILGYKTSGAFRQAIARNALPVDVFTIPGRRGRFCLVSRVAEWIAVVSADPVHTVATSDG